MYQNNFERIDYIIRHKGEYYITEEDLDNNPNWIFCFGDNTKRFGCGGAAKLRHHPQTYGFITKVNPDYNEDSFYKPEEYKKVFELELSWLQTQIAENPDKIYLISKLGAGLANRHHIWEEVIKDGLKCLERYENVKFLYKEIK